MKLASTAEDGHFSQRTWLARSFWPGVRLVLATNTSLIAIGGALLASTGGVPPPNMLRTMKAAPAAATNAKPSTTRRWVFIEGSSLWR